MASKATALITEAIYPPTDRSKWTITGSVEQEDGTIRALRPRLCGRKKGAVDWLKKYHPGASVKVVALK